MNAIKRIQLLTRCPELSLAAFHARWVEAFSAAPSCKRAVACLVLHQESGCTCQHDLISMEWFDDSDAMQHSAPSALTDPSQCSCIVVEEHVLRGADWLDRRWADPTARYKHMALARRAAGLSQGELSERWRARAGRIGGAGAAPAQAIPEGARGLAYVQNHPIETLTPHPRYDALNEVYFDALKDMRERIAFFAAHDPLRVDADLVQDARFAVVRELVLL